MQGARLGCELQQQPAGGTLGRVDRSLHLGDPLQKDGSKLTVPWATISRFEGGKLAEYNAYVDASKLFNP
ncbi:hypothetical protein [Corallococcus llansteffanensis]|uniref:Nuclear transport factor 2 family protein n=1 Tax=Corallococcus llansteffanensis TaxID=2316731 RepID=A0A3A8PF18_9BACT|nr:hypothetical protein [Corallococcus llansteffanensis]RKH54579.1 hypothetical protein D7V93_25350 [Corallococcus llansteffanensis]